MPGPRGGRKPNPLARVERGPIAADVLGRNSVLRTHRAHQFAEKDEWNKQAETERAAAREARDWTDTGKIFTGPDGSWLHPDHVSEAFKRITATTDLPPINLHDLRHGAAGLVKAGGGKIEDAMKKLRHSTIVLTADTCMPLFEGFADELEHTSHSRNGNSDLPALSLRHGTRKVRGAKCHRP